MAETEKKRILQVKTLAELLPKGTEGGKEFARIVDLLLFHDARRAGKKITLFNDASGDYYGLDSFAGDPFRKQGTTGFQYKFYPSPLSAQHRSEIKKSLIHSLENQIELKLKKWVLVTPEDLTESARRNDGGDVAWFNALGKDLEIELNHWGHKELLALFMETPSICLFYYPELVPDGAARRKTIQDTFKRYNDNLHTSYGKIDFVGMSVYKPEAAKGVEMEHIYIPLSVVPEDMKENDPMSSRLDPLGFLAPGCRRVVLGDPGSGKSTMMKFLALVGQSPNLQKRYKAKPDNRLPILVTLRRYADLLKAQPNLSLIDYIIEVTQGDYCLKSADLEFFEYYLESGSAILLFDGLDELPNPHFKKDTANRIRAIMTTYPGNTALVTSRIVGYDSSFRLDGKEFAHYRLEPLRLPEIEQFVNDWYAVRIENNKERDLHANDLIRIIKDKDQPAIRELAGNPLLLTIIALVHRIDAVLPDERVVLYQKCTETLLNTWHTWKFRDNVPKHKGRIERRNRTRMEAIAHWIHGRSTGTGSSQRAVVPYDELKQFLMEFIEAKEKYRSPAEDPEDMAEEFLKFIKERAGLLIEIGDNQYSFLHLTFQEYLTASYIMVLHEKDSVEEIWKTIKPVWTDDRWMEVIRLLIASLKADETKEVLIDKLLSASDKTRGFIKARLLGGLLLDGIQPAEYHGQEILHQVFTAAIKVNKREELAAILFILNTCRIKDQPCASVIDQAFLSTWNLLKDDRDKLALILVAKSLNWTDHRLAALTGDFLESDGKVYSMYRWFIRGQLLDRDQTELLLELELLNAIEVYLPLYFYKNGVVTAAYQGLHGPFNRFNVLKHAFNLQLALLNGGAGGGGYLMFNVYGILFNPNQWMDSKNLHAIALARDRDRDRALALDRALARARDRARALDRARDRARALARALDRAFAKHKENSEGENTWDVIIANPAIHGPMVDILCDMFDLSPREHWREALRVNVLPALQHRQTIVDPTLWQEIEEAFSTGKAGEADMYGAAWLLLFDAFLYMYKFYQTPADSPFNSLAQLTRSIDEPPLQIAHCIRGLAFGDETRSDELAGMVKSKEPGYQDIFRDALWID